MIVLLMVGMMAMAQSNRMKWVIDEGNPLNGEDAIQPGMNIVIQEGVNTGGWSAGHFLHSGESSSESPVITDECIYQVEETGEMSGEDKLYILKNVSKNAYLANGETRYVTNPEKAFMFTIKMAREVDPDAMEQETYKNDLVESTRSAGAGGVTYVFYSPTEQVYIAMGYNPSFWAYKDTNNWYVYEATQVAKTGEEQITELLESKLLEGQVSQAQFPVGDVPGSIPQDVYTALETAYNDAMGLYELEESEVTDEMWWDAADALDAAIEAAYAAIKPVTAGYYQIIGYTPAAADGTPSKGRGVYATKEGVKWTSSYDPITEVDYSKSAYIWQLTATTSEEGDELSRFYIKNFGTDTYLGTHASNSSIIPMTKEAEEKWGFIPSSNKARGGYFDVVNETRGNGVSFNCDPAGTVVFWATAAGDNGFFRFVAVDQSIIDEMAVQVEKNRKLAALKEVYATAETAFNKGRVYTVAEDCETNTYEYNIPGVFEYNAATENATTNAPQTDGDYGPVEYLFDNNLLSYFHSAYQGDMAGTMDDEGKALHYLQVNLDEALQNVTLKYTQRRNNGGWPLKFLVTASEDGETWVEEGEVTLPYQIAAPEDYTGAGGKTGYTAFKMSKPYQYLRFASLDNGQNKLFWHMAEMRFYEGGGDYDPANSTYETVAKEYRDELEKQMAAALAEIEAGEATEATTEALKKAVEAFNEHYPDMAIIEELLEEANSWKEVGEELEGTELGCIEEGATAELVAALDAATAGLDEEGLQLTYDEIQAVKAEIRGAINDFNSKLITPEDGAVFRIQSGSMTEGEANDQTNKVLYAPNSDLEVVKFGFYDEEEGESFSERIETLWKVIKNEDGTYMFQNLATGHYLGNPGENDVVVKFTNDTDSAKVTLRSARVKGFFNIVMDNEEGVFANAQPGGNIVTWGTANGTDNSAFALVDADPSDYDVQLIDVQFNRYQIMTLPYAIENYTDYGTPLAVLGLKDNAIQLVEFEGDNVPAGTPFIYYAYDEEGSTEYTSDYLTLVEPVDAMTYATEASVQNGLLGTLTSFTLEEAGYGVLNTARGQVFATEEGEEHYVYANTGIFGANIPATEEDGELAIPVVGELSKDVNTGIASAEIVKNNSVDVYTITGVKVRNGVRNVSATKGLPSGLYIVGGKKVLVK